MSKAEEFIQQNVKDCANKSLKEGEYYLWLTPSEAREAVEIARKEMLNEVYEWIEENIGEYCDGEYIMFSATDIANIDIFEQERFINDLKQAMKDE